MPRSLSFRIRSSSIALRSMFITNQTINMKPRAQTSDTHLLIELSHPKDAMGKTNACNVARPTAYLLCTSLDARARRTWHQPRTRVDALMLANAVKAAKSAPGVITHASSVETLDVRGASAYR